MILSESRLILLGSEPTPGCITLDNVDDKVEYCVVEGGLIVARVPVWFDKCTILGEKPVVLGRMPPEPAARVHSCMLINTKLPDAYYSMCYFKGNK